MDQKTRWVCLAAGCGIVLLGIRKLYLEGDWVLAILGTLIVAFSAVGIMKSRQKKDLEK